MDMQVRRARSEDRAHLLGVWERSVRATHHFLADHEVTALQPLVAAELAGDQVDWWVLIRGEVSIGFLGVADGAIEALFIDADYRGSGGGQFLVAHAQSLFVGRPLAVDVNEQNEAALRFYESAGFSVVGRSALDAGGRPLPILHMRRAAKRL